MLADGLATRLQARLQRGRAAAEARMTSIYEIGIYGPWRYDKAAGREVRDLLDSFETKARVRARSSQTQRETEVGERTVVSVDRELHIPWDAPVVPNNAVARPIALDPVLSDPTLAGADLQIIGPVPGDQLTARRLLIREVLS